VINNGTPSLGRSGVAQMAVGLYADVQDLALRRDGMRVAGDHMAYLWTFTGHHAGTKAPLTVIGWEEWDLDADQKVKASCGWFDGDDYVRQVGA
jgi:hypothetical protein